MIDPERAIDTIQDRFGRHAGCRALHARGIVCAGSFTATPAGARLTRAIHMQGEPVAVSVRFSHGSGDPGAPDYLPFVRGMATTFHLPDGGRTDISAQTVPCFTNRSPEDFIELIRLSKPGLSRALKLPLFLARRPETRRALRVNRPVIERLPASYAACRYYALHAFRWVDSTGSVRYVRYRWVPEAAEAAISKDEARAQGREYLTREIGERLAREPVRFTLEVQLAAADDPVDDPSAMWPEERELVAAGTIELTTVASEGQAPDEPLVFDPMRLVDGIEPSDDPVLHFRPRAYAISAERRMGAPA